MLTLRALVLPLSIGLGAFVHQAASGADGPFGRGPVASAAGSRMAPQPLPPLPPMALPSAALPLAAKAGGPRPAAPEGGVWPSSDPRGLPPLPSQASFQSPSAPLMSNPVAGLASPQASAALTLSMIVISPMGNKALFGGEWARAGDFVPGQTRVRIAHVCGGRIGLDTGATVRVGQALPPPTSHRTAKNKALRSDACL